MYTVYKSSLEHLNFKASHDELTGAYNRSGYELLLTGIDLSSTYMLLFDVDDFKSINDNYGHDVGDKALKRLVQVLRNNFRSDDYICRLGGDEFVVFMVHSTEMQHNLITSKIEEISRELAVSVEGLPPISVSVGIMHGSEAADAKSLFEKTDEAMYHAKQSGKHTFAFYNQ
jgi:diguanylate cyclase (GGDEF)-like protein